MKIPDIPIYLMVFSCTDVTPVSPPYRDDSQWKCLSLSLSFFLWHKTTHPPQIGYFSTSYVTRWCYFWKALVKTFVTKVAQIFNDCWTVLKRSFYTKTVVATYFWETFKYFLFKHIWSHCTTSQQHTFSHSVTLHKGCKCHIFFILSTHVTIGRKE